MFSLQKHFSRVVTMPSRKSSKPKRPPRKKRLSRESALGQLGVNLIEKIVTEMGSRWTPTGELEVGIDGYVELFEPNSRTATGLHLSVQSKAATKLKGDDNTVTFQCRRDDIAYWLSVQPRVILVVSQPSTGEAYWLSIEEYFGRPENADATVATFDRSSRRFTPASYDGLLEAARHDVQAVTRSPVAVHETIYSNLAPLEDYPSTMFVAAATCGSYEAARARLRADTEEYPPKTWALRENMLFSLSDPAQGLLKRVVDPGTVEEHAAADWAESNDEDKRRLFVELLNNALIDDLGFIGVRFHRDDRVFAFKGTPDRVPRTYTLQNVRRESTITVVEQYTSRAKDGREFPFLRHSAFGGRFRRLAQSWFLEITPTYRFTTDGHWKYRFHEDQLAGIKRLEGNRAVLSQVLLWNDVLRSRLTLFGRRSRLLQFGWPPTFQLDRGIPETEWKAAAPAQEGIGGGPQLDLLELMMRTEP